jgi:uncharacterized protein with LGFP repeats
MFGEPYRGEGTVAGALGTQFQFGSIFWRPAVGASSVQGAIAAKFDTLGGPDGWLGLPVGDEEAAPGGRRSLFTGANGAIYYSMATGAWSVQGSVRSKWETLGGAGGFYGYPISDEDDVPGGKVSRFQRGAVYFSNATGAQSMNGAIYGKFQALGGPAVFGFPITDEQAAPNGGRMQPLSRYNAALYFTPSTGAHLVQGSIRAAWDAQGGAGGTLGYPVTDEYAVPGGYRTDFQNGSIIFTSATGTTQTLRT